MFQKLSKEDTHGWRVARTYSPAGAPGLEPRPFRPSWQPGLFLARPLDFLLRTLIKVEIAQRRLEWQGGRTGDFKVAVLIHKVNSQ